MDTPASDSLEARSLVLLDLPSEIHMQIASLLQYPDALALKHTSRHFYYMVYTGVHLKVDWLVERFERKLECPMEKCSFRTDEAFCNDYIRRIMERRRWHQECRSAPGGCWVVEGQTCKSDIVQAWIERHRKYCRVEWLTYCVREVIVVAAISLIFKVLWDFAIRIYAGQESFIHCNLLQIL